MQVDEIILEKSKQYFNSRMEDFYICLLYKFLFVLQEDGSGIRQLGLQAQGSR